MGKFTNLVFEAIAKKKEGSEAFGNGNYVECVSCLERAIKIVDELPAEADFDKPIFLASCRAELSGSNGKLGRHEDAISVADLALRTFRPVGYQTLLSLYPNEAMYYFAAAFNRAQSLYNLGKLDDAQNGFFEARDIFPFDDGELERHLTEQQRQEIKWRKLCFEHIEQIEFEKRS